jgi:putative MFS transporter
MRNDSMAAKPNAGARLERLPMSRYQYTLFVVVATAFLFDTADTAALGYMLGRIKAELGLSVAQAGVLASASLLGMLFGAGSAGILADRFGRKPVFQFSMVLWGIGSLLCGLSTTYAALLGSRLVLGLGMGMELPIALALVAEYMPTHLRGRFTAVLEGFLPIGFIAVGILVYFLMPLVGWKGVFIALSVPALFLFVIRRTVPESPRWLEATGRLDEAERVMALIEGRVMRAAKLTRLPDPVVSVVTLEADTQHRWFGSIKDLWHPDYRDRTRMLWIVWFFSQIGYYGLTSWLASLLEQAGYAGAKSILYTIVMSFAGIPGFIGAAYLLERWGRKPTAALYLLGGAAAAFVYGQCISHQADLPVVIAAGLAMQFFIFGMWSVIYAYTPEHYPTRSRGTGSSMASSVGRIGSILGPAGIAFILPHTGTVGAFGLGACSFAIAAGAILWLGVETKGVPLN